MKAKFYICEHCGNLVTTIHNAGVPLVCCGEKMKELLPNTVEASGEKHLPVAELSGSTLTVTVGAVEHPMVDVHHIQWLFVETENGGQLRYLTPGQAPKAVFELGSEKPVAVYAYCNLHGLWMTKIKKKNGPLPVVKRLQEPVLRVDAFPWKGSMTPL